MENYTSDLEIKQEVTEESVCESEDCSLVEPVLNCKIEIEEHELYATASHNVITNEKLIKDESLAEIFQKTSSRSKRKANSLKHNLTQDSEFVDVIEQVTDLILVQEEVDSVLIQKQLEIRRAQIEFVNLVEDNNLTLIPEETELNAKKYAKRNRATSKKPPSYRQLKIKLPNTKRNKVSTKCTSNSEQIQDLQTSTPLIIEKLKFKLNKEPNQVFESERNVQTTHKKQKRTKSPDKQQQKVKKRIKFDEPPKQTNKNIKVAQLPTNEGIKTKRSRINKGRETKHSQTQKTTGFKQTKHSQTEKTNEVKQQKHSQTEVNEVSKNDEMLTNENNTNTTDENQNKDKNSPIEPKQESNLAIKNEDINLQNLYQSHSDELNDLQDFPAPVVRHKLPRRKPQFTEEQLAEKKRKFMERRTCTICGAVFAYTGGLRNHIRSKHTFEKLYTCDFCDEKFIVQSTYLLHRQRHLGIRPHLCNLCGKTFLRRIDMNIHMRIHIPYKDKIRDVKCNFCPKVYTSKTNLRKHTLSKHTDPSEWKHECHMCGKKLYSGTALTHHIRYHNDDRRYKCVICGRGFFTKQTMDIHVRTHTASTPFNCEHCSKGYRSNEALQRHLVKVHGIGEEKPASAPTYFCPVCTAGFRYKSRLEQHMEVHETGKEEYPYECEKCQRRYKARHYFTIHMLERHGIKIDESYFKTFLAVPQENRTNDSNIAIIDYQNFASGDNTKNMVHQNSDASYIDPDEPDL